MKLFRMAACAGALALAPALAQAETWTMATPYPEGNFHTENVHWFADEVEKATDGSVTIDVHSGASMYPMAQLKRALRTGQIPIAEFFLSAYGNEDPIYEADSVPFFANGQDEARKLYAAQKPMVDARLEKEGLVGLYSVPWPGNGLYTKNAVESMDDFSGMRMRAQTAILARLAELMGSNPVDVQFVEVPQAFQTGVIEAMFTAGTTGVDTQSWDYLDHFYDIAFISPRNIVAVNKGAWDGLSEEQRTAILDVARQAEERGWNRAKALEVEAKETLKANGITTHDELPPEVAAAMEKIGNEMISSWVDEAGDDGKTIAQTMGWTGQ